MQKTSFFKRIMTLFLAFIMMLGLLPISQFTAPAYAAEASGGPPATTTIHDANLWTAYQSPILGTVIPRLFTFNMGSGVAPGFCADHSKDFSKSATWENPVPISETKYNFCMPLIAQYNWFWFYSVDVDQRYPGTSVEFKQNIAEQERGSIFYYWSEKDRISYSAILQSALWLTGADKITTLDDPSVQLMIAAERNRALTKMQGYCSETDQEVAGWVKEAITKYDRGDYGEWDVYYYTPRGSSSIQPMVVTVPPTTVEEREGWIKIKKTDQSGNALAGATFGVYLDSACQNPVGEFTTTADEWTYYQIPSMTESTQTFYLKETSAPEGYVANSKGYSVTVSATNNSTQETAAAVNGGAAIKNGKHQPPEGVVNKVDQDGNGIGPATFHFKSLTNSVDADFVTDENGELQLQWTDPAGENYIQPGEYTVTEKIAPPGYELSDEAQNLRLWIKDVNGVPTPMSSGPITFVNLPKHSVIIQKVDESGNGLPGAVFEVYFNGALIDTITTGADGTFTYAGTDGNGLEFGTYDFVEVKAPDGYLLPYRTCQSITINPEIDEVRVHQLTFVNYTYPEIVIQKVSAGEEQPLAGAVFEVMIDGTNLGTFGPTGPDGTIIINHDVYGKFLTNDKQDTWTVQVREVEAPAGYLLDSTDWQTAEISRGTKLAPFVFTDTKYPEIVIRKSDRETEEMLPGTTFEISIDAGASFSLTKQTDENGEIWITYEDYEEFIGDIVWDRGWTVTVTETIMPEFYNKDKQ